MKRLVFLSTLLLSLFLIGCDSNGSGGFFSSFRNYTETGDLKALQKRETIRFLAPRFDEPAGLPREGMPATLYREQAEAFAESLGLRPQWVFADSFAELPELLLAGRGDVIVSNYSVTQARQEKLAFSTPVNTIQEILVLPAAHAGKSLADFESLLITVPVKTAYQETAEKLASRYDNLSVEVLQQGRASDAMLEAVASGELQAVIVDSNTLAPLLLDRDDVVAGPVVNVRRHIAWAARPGNPDLLERINKFITSERLAAAALEQSRRDWAEIKQSGVLRVITSNNPASYFMWRGELMGFDYDLIREFARQNGLRVNVTVRNTPDELLAALQQGHGDLIAAAMTVTDSRQEQGWVFSRRYLEVQEQVVGRSDEAQLESVEELQGRRLVVNPQTAYRDTLAALQEQGLKLRITEIADASTEMLIDKVARGEYDLTLADSHLAAMETTYRDDIAPLYTFAEVKEIAWGLRDDQPQLKERLDRFIGSHYRGTFFNVTFNRYFREPRSITRYVEHRVEPGRGISPYDDLVRDIAREYGFDWRLITSQMYQESRFNPNARSFAGAQGLMQIMPRTAAQLGYSNVVEPANGIRAGITYMDWLEDRLPGDLPVEERLFFILASYNAGHGHVEDARRLAQRLGKDPNRWFGNVEEAMLLLSQPQYARQARYGYVRGREPVNYVRQIKQRYLGYVAALDRE